MSLDIIHPHVHDLGAFTVRRTLPAASHRLVGPFIFFDHMGPTELPAGVGMDVRPHPHIGLATVTYLFAGSAMHRDSLGSVQVIVPGDINWMSAGRGIVHSERSTPEALGAPQALHGLQIWVALPASHEDSEPSFSHHAAASLPTLSFDGVEARVLLGQAFGSSSPVPVASPTVYVHLTLGAGARMTVDVDAHERALYPVDGPIVVDQQEVPAQNMVVLAPGSSPTIECVQRTTVMLLGGAPLEGPRFINWNFVASSRERIESARQDWMNYPNNRFAQVPGETEFIPLPPSRL